MIKYIILLSLGFFLSKNSFAQKEVIFDTDFGGDADDLGALVMLHAFADQGIIDFKAVISWSTEEYTIPAIDAVNTFYGRPDLPIAVRKDGKYHQDWTHGKPIADQFDYNEIYESVPEAVDMYRAVLSNAKDSSITIITVGPLLNIKNLLESSSDKYSMLKGDELIHKKVKEFVIMGGKYPEGEWEWNFSGNMPGVTKSVIEKLEVPVTFLGYELGLVIKTGEALNDLNALHPLYIGYKHFSEYAEWINKDYNGRILDNASYDQTAVLYAAEGGVGKYWERVENGYCNPDDEGGNTWVPAQNTNHSYLKLIIEPELLATRIENLMLFKE